MKLSRGVNTGGWNQGSVVHICSLGYRRLGAQDFQTRLANLRLYHNKTGPNIREPQVHQASAWQIEIWDKHICPGHTSLQWLQQGSLYCVDGSWQLEKGRSQERAGRETA